MTMPAIDANVASHGQDSTLKVSDGSTLLQAPAEHATATSPIQIFAETLGCAGGEKGKEGSEISKGRNRSQGSSWSSSIAKAREVSESDSDDEESISDGEHKYDLSNVLCNKCKQKGHYANRCPEDKTNASPGREPKRSSSRSSHSSKSSNGSWQSGKPCHFHRPWRSQDRGGPKKCTNDACAFKHCDSKKEFYKLSNKTGKKKPTATGAVGSIPPRPGL